LNFFHNRSWEKLTWNSILGARQATLAKKVISYLQPFVRYNRVFSIKIVFTGEKFN
jgi:hypothetical protein